MFLVFVFGTHAQEVKKELLVEHANGQLALHSKPETLRVFADGIPVLATKKEMLLANVHGDLVLRTL
jgi:hypothetical protein